MPASAGSTQPPRTASPGVVAVFTGADMAADKVGPMAPLWAIVTSDGKPMAEPPRWALARDTVRHVGEAVAAVIAETHAQAEAAAELVDIQYEPLPRSSMAARRSRRTRRNCTMPRPAMSASVSRAATRPPCRRHSKAPPTSSDSISPTTG